MNLQVETIGDVTFVLLPGRNLDASNTAKFKAEVAPLIKTHKAMVFDLADVEFMDSSGLGALLSCLRQVTAAGGDMKLCNMGKTVRVLCEVVRMHRVFDILDSREAAIAAFAA
jgi:anti-sigma B factor antagonist